MLNWFAHGTSAPRKLLKKWIVYYYSLGQKDKEILASLNQLQLYDPEQYGFG
jgi:hypothetical protein